MAIELGTDRLVLRSWRVQDRAPFAALNADPVVMEHFPSTLTTEQSDAFVDFVQAAIDARGWGIWAAERREDGAFIGFIGITPVSFESDFTPAVEVGWRLARPYWGCGLATEGGRAALDFAFATLGLERVVAFTAQSNQRSEAVMLRLGMHEAGEFDHPRIPDGHRLRRHLLYEATSLPPSAGGDTRWT